MWKGPSSLSKQSKKQVRKPISANFSPKRLAINFSPPTMILQYLVIDTGKLYHHKMRLDSVLRKQNVFRTMVLDYIKTKHHLYFVNTKLKDEQILKFIDKLLIKLGKEKLQKIQEKSNYLEQTPQENINQNDQQEKNQDNDFDYLNDDDQYEEDYQDYEEQEKYSNANNNKNNLIQSSSFSTKSNLISPPFNNKNNKQTKNQNNNNDNNNKNTFMTYCQQQYDDDNGQGEEQANWDLDIDENADFDFV